MFLSFSPKFWIHRQSQCFSGCGLSDWEISWPMAQTCKAFLQVQRHRIIDFRTDFLTTQSLFQGVTLAISDSHHELVEDVVTAFKLVWKDQNIVAQILGEEFVISLSHFPTAGGPVVEMAEFHSQNGRLKSVQA